MKIFSWGVLIVFLAWLGIFFYLFYRLYTAFYIHVSEDEASIKKYSKSLDLTAKNEVSFITSDGVKLAGWYLPVEKPKAFVILVHGYRVAKGGKALGLAYAKFLKEAGYSTFLFDFRSVGDSAGNHISLGAAEWRDVVAAYDYVKQLPETKGKKIGYLGVSMGAATTITAVGESGKGDFVIASVPFAGFYSQLLFRIEQEHLPAFVFAPALRLALPFLFGFDYSSYDPIKLVGKIHVPLIIFQAKRDDYVNPAAELAVYKAANEPKELWQADAGHDIFKTKPEEFEKAVLDFLGKYVTN